MFITYNPTITETGNVTAYSDKLRNSEDLKPDEIQTEVDMDFSHVACVEGGLNFLNGALTNNGATIALEKLEVNQITQ